MKPQFDTAVAFNYMLTRIITGFFLFVFAGLWLFFPVAETASARFLGLDIFNLVAVLIVVIGGWEFSKLVFPDNSVSTAPVSDSSGVRESRNLFLKRCLYALFVFLSALLSFKYVVREVSLGDWARPAEILSNLSNGFVFWILLAGFAWWVLATVMVFCYPRSGVMMRSWWQRAIYGLLTLIPFGVSLMLLRDTGITHYGDDPYIGSRILLSVMMLVWSADSGAYFAGRLLGKHHMSAHVSPKKTWEGLAGGVLLALAVYGILYGTGMYTVYYSNFAALTVSAVLAVIFSVFGDLSESMFKRYAGIKDSGVLFPGHGGMLDRIDSLCAAVPVFLVSYSILSVLLS